MKHELADGEFLVGTLLGLLCDYMRTEESTGTELEGGNEGALLKGDWRRHQGSISPEGWLGWRLIFESFWFFSGKSLHPRARASHSAPAEREARTF